MKKIITITALMAAVCMLGGCGSSKDKAQEATTQAQVQEETAGTYEPVEMDASEYVKLGEYKGLTVETEVVEVTDEDVDEELSFLQQQYAEYKEITDRKDVQEGDYINISYTATVDGKENADYSDSDIDVYIGDGELNDYFGDLGDDFDVESKVIGAKSGKSVSVDFTFPEDYDDEEVAGKKCTVKITVNKIQEEILPELTDEFIKENTDCDTLKAYRKQTKDELENTYSSDAEETAQQDLLVQIEDSSTMKKEFTDAMIQQEINNLKVQNAEYAEYFGMEVEDFLEQSSGMTLEECAKDTLKMQCVQELLLEAEEIEVTDEEYEEELSQMMSEGGYTSKEDFLEYYPEEDMRSDIAYQKLMEKLMSYTTVKQTTAEKEETEAE